MQPIYDGENISTVANLPNPNLKWEQTAQTNIGWDLGFFDGRLNIGGDFYYKKTTDLFTNVDVSPINGIMAGLFALIALFVSTKTMDSVIKGFNTAMQFLIISPNQEEIVRRIHTEMDRGCTRLEATGTYEGRKNGALLCVVPRMEASRLKKIVSECDAHAFVTVCDVHEALGEGFSYRHIS